MTYIWPIENALQRVTQDYASNANSVQPNGHNAIDFGGDESTPLLAVCDGVIAYEGFAENLGWPNAWGIFTNAQLPRAGGAIMIALDNGPYQFWYGHCSRTVVNIGDHVKQGQIIGYMGNTGYSFGTHLHFEVLPDRWNIGAIRAGRINPRSVIDGVPVRPLPGAPLKPNERMIGGSPVNLRADPWVAADNLVDVYPAGRRDVFTHWAHGGMVDWNGAKSDIWLYDGAGWLSVLFVDPSVPDGLKEVDVKLPWEQEPAPVPVPPPPAPKPVLHGIDISSHQGNISLVNVAADFVFIKATEGVGYRSPTLDAQVRDARAANKRVAFYHFARFGSSDGNTAAAEALWFTEVVRQVAQPGDVLALDLESDDHDPTKAEKWLTLVQGLFGGLPLIYLNSTAINGHDWSSAEQRFPLWLASYPAGVNNAGYNPPADHKTSWAKGVAIWQYTSSGRLPGYDGDLDLNVFSGTAADWAALGITKLPTVEQPPPVVVPPPAAAPAVTEPIAALVKFYGG
jgi:GH25 family lysozyme M1 (1,4-beta-N-acetylmuramidase)